MGSYAPLPFDIKKIAIIGAGPCGLAAARYLLDRDVFTSVVIFEQQHEVGGVWNYSRDPPGSVRVPQIDPFGPPEAPLPPRKTGDAPIFPSPMYETLHANIPGSLMNYKDRPFPQDAWAYPSRQTIQNYIGGYAEDLWSHIKFNVQVESVELTQDAERDRWILKAKSTVDDETIKETFDAVVVANGHYSVPFLPEVKNIKAFHTTHPDIIIHSKNYRTPEPFAGKRVVVVGNGPSGLDIARQITGVGAQTLLSVRSPTPTDKLEHVGATEIAEIVEFLPDQQAIRLKDGSVQSGIDAIIYCTGFLFSYPFLPGLAPKLLTKGKGVFGLYRHLFLIQHPTLVFPGLLMKAVPFPLSEAQAAVVAAVWSNSLLLPPVEEQEKWERGLREERGENLHTFPTHGGDGLYINELHDWALKGSPAGLEAPFWNDESRWERSIFADAKVRFEQRGTQAKTLKELGFVYPGEGHW
ncbi:hypothetical protein BN1708_003117 [Verticillium longisporum]|uniref:FAD/NAD(P)-binding domain-containing protein n=2 Tax=Verticillium longisporum TaxID=100787 RepID=A0A0G4L9T5_VERLO|nr:hypothetical protein BN1708_003117 [Verticillium longisporum]